MKKYLGHPIYWTRRGLAYPVMSLGFGIENVSTWIYKFSNWVQNLAINIEGEIPEGAE